MYISQSKCDSLSDKEIIELSLKDVEYFRCLYNRYAPRLKLYVSKISDFSKEQIKDIIQDAFVNVWKNINAYDDSMKFSSFLYRIVHNETVSHWRKQRTINKTLDVLGKESSANTLNYNREENGTIYEEKKEKIEKVLSLLPPKYREILVLKFLENMDYEEISNILMIPEGTVATRINRAKKAFAKIAKKEFSTAFGFDNKNRYLLTDNNG